jgi:hypothetical protein
MVSPIGLSYGENPLTLRLENLTKPFLIIIF